MIPRTAVQWGVATSLWVGGLVAVSPVAGTVALVPVADTMLRTIPGPVATLAIEAFGQAAQPLLVVAVGVGVVATAVVAGAIWTRAGVDAGRWRCLRVPLLLVLGVALFAAGQAPLTVVSTASVAAAVLPVAAYLHWVDPRPSGTDHARRSALRRTGAGLAAVAGLGSAATVVDQDPNEEATAAEQRKQEQGRTITPTRARTERESADGLPRVPADESLGFGFGSMPNRVESIQEHYVVDININDPSVSDGWTLNVGGAVETPISLSRSGLAAHKRVRTETVTMHCISNPVGGDLISTVEWEVVPLVALLDDAGVYSSAVDVVTQAVDGYTEAIPVELAREEVVLVAIGVDDGPLPREHGAPARLLVPGRYGIKSTKWLSKIDLVEEEHSSYWETRGWNEQAVVKTFSAIRAAVEHDDRVAVGGVAFAGLRGVDRVEVSVDGGETWHDAELEAAPSQYSWRRWRYVFPAPGSDELETVVRATDGQGALQPVERSRPHPSGATGWHRRTFEQ